MADPWVSLLIGGTLLLVGFAASLVFERYRVPDFFMLILLVALGLSMTGKSDMPPVPEIVGKVLQDPNASAEDLAAAAKAAETAGGPARGRSRISS